MKANYCQHLAGITLLVLPLAGYSQSDNDLDVSVNLKRRYYAITF
jgi:hypothetical protein